jgi:exosortase O
LRLLVEMLHLPLGVIGFLAACVGGLALLRWVSAPANNQPQGTKGPDLDPQRPVWLAPCLGLAISTLILGSSQPPSPVRADALHLEFPGKLNTQTWPLSASELAWLSDDGTVAAQRYRFSWEQLDGSLLLVTSQDWRAQHKPERCFTVYGLEVQSSQPIVVEPDFPLRLLTLGAQGGKTLYSAFYWLQSATQITDDYAARIWDELTPNPQPWVLVTVIFDEPVDAQSQGARNLLAVVRNAAQNALTSEARP